MSFGSFMGGVTSGLDTAHKYRRQRQLDKIYDSGIREIENADAAHAIDIEKADRDAGGEPTVLSDYTLGDPILSRLFDAFRRKPKVVTSAIPVEAPARMLEEQQVTADYLPEDPVFMADGGQAQARPLTPEEIQARADARQARLAGEPPPRQGYDYKGGRSREYVNSEEAKARAAEARSRSAGGTYGSTETPEPVNRFERPSPKPSRTGKIGDAASRGTKAAIRGGKVAGQKVRAAISSDIGIDKLGGVKPEMGALARTGARAKGLIRGGAVTAAALPAITTGWMDAPIVSTEDMAKAQGTDYLKNLPDDPLEAAWYDAKIRTKGTLGMYKDALLDQFGFGSDEKRKQAVAAPAAPAAPAASAASGSAPAAPGMATLDGVTVTGRKAVESAANPSLEELDFSGANVMDVPKYTTRDWQQFRADAVRSMVRRGESYENAVDKVDQQVINMQMRGFSALANQGMTLLATGDKRGAVTAFTAAFNLYFPSTTSVEFAELKGGQLVAYGVDEDTGERVGQPVVVNPETLSAMMKNFSSPGAWAEHAQDRETLDKVMIPQAQSVANSRAALARASMIKAVGGADAGLTPSEGLASDKAAGELIDKYALTQNDDGELTYPELQDPQIRNQLIMVLKMLSRKDPGKPADELLQQILALARTGPTGR